MPKIRITGNYDQAYKALTSDDLELRDLVDERVSIFRKNPQDTRLRDHALRKSMKGKYAFSITDNIRIVYERVGVNTVRFLSIGTHPQVYSRKKKS